MSDLINAALAATVAGRTSEPASGPAASGPRIITANRDITSINYVAGLSDPGEMIRCGAYQELRRKSGESDAVYQARIHPLVMALPENDRAVIMSAAIRRAGLDTSGGRISVMVAGAAPWHGLGVNVESAVTSTDAITLAGLNWKVSKRDMTFTNARGEVIQAPDTFAISRDDTGAYLGSVGGRYQPFQNEDAFKFLDGLLERFGARYETAGAIHGGKKVWMLVHLPKQAFRVTAGDEIKPFALFTNAHDGTEAAKCFPTAHRVVCANTLRMADKDDRSKGITIRHTGNLQAKRKAAAEALGLAVEEFEEFRESAEVMARTPMEPLAYFNGLLDSVCDITAAQLETGIDAVARTLKVTRAEQEYEKKRLEAEAKHRKELLEDVLDRYHSDTNGVGGIRGSAWSAFNAVTESVDHGKLGGKSRARSEEAKRSARFESVISGAGDDIKQTAYQLATAAVRN
jgi:phage/plasmid-like protein (TIGR03299 family)